MSDYYGTGQNRVLEIDGRGLDNVVFLTGRPPLSSEWNLINQIGNQKALETSRLALPSGWMRVGDTSSTMSESDAQSGDVLTSESYEADTFKLVSKGGNVAVVNGWRILVQGVNSPDDNNIIELNAAAGQRYDFVFLEVWRKLVSHSDPLYPYGNITATPYTDNEILWPAVGTETSQRVQVQYRIRSESVSTVLSPDSDVFADVGVHPIGGRSTGEYTFYSFSPKGADDVGLYVAGDGSTTAQTNLETVDGYVYAVPMFLVYRRVPSASVFNATQINNGYTTVARLADGYVKDRPDATLADAVCPEDIVDFRHRIASDSGDVADSVQVTLSRLLAGDLTTAVERGYDVDGLSSSAVSGAAVLTKAERINSTGSDNIPNMGTGDGLRRAFCNASVKHNNCVVEVPINGATWAAGTILVSSFLSKTYGDLVSVDGAFSPDLGSLVTGVTYDVMAVTIAGGSNLIGTSWKLYLEFTFEYEASASGFKDVPRQMLEASKGTYMPIATRDRTVGVRFNDSQQLLYFGLTPNVGDTDAADFVRYRGGNYTEGYNFGHELVIHRTTNGAGTWTESLTGGKLNGYYILGVKSVRPKSGSTYGDPAAFNVVRSVTVGPPYVVDDYQITAGAYPNTDVQITLYTGSKVPDDAGSAYDLAGSMKFFETNKQGRGVTDTYEMIEVVAEEDTPSNPGDYVIDTSSIGKPIIALATKTSMDGGFEKGVPQAFKHSDGSYFSITESTINDSLPVVGSSSYTVNRLPTRVVVSGATGAAKIRVAVLVHSAVAASENPYTFYYRMTPYQGILSSSTEIRGKLLSDCGALLTSLGSGSITNHGYSDGTITILNGARVVSGSTGVDWSGKVQAGDYLAVGATGVIDENVGYRVDSVTGTGGVELSELYVGAGYTGAPYAIYRLDTPSSGASNVVDRLPSYVVTDSTDTYVTDHSCKSDDLSVAAGSFKLLDTSAALRSNDPLASRANDFILGAQVKTNTRGRYDFLLASSATPVFRLEEDTPRPHVLYQSLSAAQSGGRRKVCQFYLFARSASGLVSGTRDLTGRLYLVAVSGETCSGTENLLSTFSSVDSVDAFELVGRPVVKAP